MLGRTKEWSTIDAMLDPARRTCATLAIVAGAGNGTSALLTAAARVARLRDFRVLRTAGHPDETDLDGLTAQRLLIALRRGIPELPARVRTLATDALNLRPHSGDALASSLRALIRLRPGPTLVTVDDLHLADPVSARALTELIASPPPGPLVVLLGVRRSHAASALPAGVDVLQLAALPEAAANRLLATRLPDVAGRARRRLLRLTAGNPQAIAGFATLFPDAGTAEVLRPPPTWTEQLRQRYAYLLDNLDETTRSLALHVSAVLGDETAEVVLGAASADQVTLDRAVAAGILEPAGAAVRFADPLAGMAAYLSRPAVERAELHRRFAAMLPSDSLLRARHLAAATTGPCEPVAAALQAGGEQARKAGAYAEHAEALHLAAGLSPDSAAAARRYASALLSAGVTGQTSWVCELHAAAGRLDPTAIGPAVTVEVALALSRGARQREAMDRLLAGAHEKPPADATERLRLASAAALVARLSGLDEHRAIVDRLLRDTEPDETGMRAAIVAALDPYAQPPALPPAEPIADRLTALHAGWVAEAADLAGQTAVATSLRQAILARPDSGAVAELPELFLPLASSLIDAGRWPEADLLLDRAQAACDAADLRLLEVEVVAMRATLTGLRGDGPAARRMVESAWTRIDLHQNRRIAARLRQSLGIAAFAEGDHEAAYRHHRALFGPAGRALYPDFTGHMLLGLAVTAVRTGRAAEALRVLDACTGPDHPRRRMRHAQIRAMLTDDENSEAGFRGALDDPAGELWPFERALARLHYGAWLRRKRRVVDAREHLSQALDLLERLGAGGLAELARIELSAAGETTDEPGPGPEAAEPLRSLSPQQRRVVLLAAEGMSNIEIATHLRVSPRTVGTHLYNAYPKLGVGGRHELDALLRAPAA